MGERRDDLRYGGAELTQIADGGGIHHFSGEPFGEVKAVISL